MIPITTKCRRAASLACALAHLHHDEKGLLSAVNLVTLTMIMVLLVTITNVGHVTHQKIQIQNTADACAYSGAVMQARCMNAITATNHVIGEMAALVIVHEAVGGEALDRDDPMEEATRREDEELDRAQLAAKMAGATTPAYETVRQKGGVHAERTLLDSKKVLKEYLAWCYWQKAAAKAMQESGIAPVVAAGVALEAAMDLFEQIIWNEYKILNVWHEIARSLLPLKEIIRDELMPNAKKYTDTTVDAAPELAQATAEKIARMNGFRGTLFPVTPALPVVIDPFAQAQTLVFSDDQYVEAKTPACDCPSVRTKIDRGQIVKVTQLARASFPWVNYHRQPILDVLGPLLPLCGAKEFYFEHSNKASKHVCDKLQMEQDMGLYVLKDYPVPDKGYDKWTEDSALADELFCTLGLVYRRPPTVLGQSETHGDGMMAYAQAMIYNANEQERPEFRIDLTCKRIVPIRQANVGWDTLNWLPGSLQENGDPVENPPNADRIAEENRPFELVGIGLPSEFPQIQVNWQAKLTPATSTRLGDLRQAALGGGRFGGLPKPYSAVAGKLLERVPSSLRTH
jgi:hypothetical protein